MEFIAHVLAGISLLASVFMGGTLLTSTVPNVPANYDDSLATGISKTATSLTLVSGQDRAGNALSGYTCFTIDENSADLEYVCGTASSTSVTGLVRGIDPSNPNATSSALTRTHRRGANVKITDFPAIGFIRRMLNGLDTIDAVLNYGFSTTTGFTSNSHIPNKAYVDAVAIAGAPAATEDVAGISILATKDELGAGTATSTYGTSTYSLVPQSRDFNFVATATNTVPVANTSEGGLYKISPTYIATSSNYTWSGNNSYTGTSTFSGSVTNNAHTTFTATTTFDGVVIGTTKFGGDGSDGDFTATTTVFSLNSTSTFVKNFNNLSITGTSSITFTSPHSSGTVVIFRVKGDATITSATTSIYLVGMGGAGGTGGGSGGTNTGVGCGGGGGGGGTNGPGIEGTMGGGGCGSGPSGTDGVGMRSLLAGGFGGKGTNAGGGSAGSLGENYLSAHQYTLSAVVHAGAGGGGGGGGYGGTGGEGGRGGGGFLMEVRGNYTASGTVVNASGANGSDKAADQAGGGGGGGGGTVFILYNTLISDTGTYTSSGGTGGTGTGGSNGGAGGSGKITVEKNYAF
jgi:hypothetical protein